MTVKRQCPRCGKTGFIRAERVIKGRNGLTEFLCGACDHSWTEVDEVAMSQEDERER